LGEPQRSETFRAIFTLAAIEDMASYVLSSDSSALASFRFGGVEGLGEPVVDFGQHGPHLPPMGWKTTKAAI